MLGYVLRTHFVNAIAQPNLRILSTKTVFNNLLVSIYSFPLPKFLMQIKFIKQILFQ